MKRVLMVLIYNIQRLVFKKMWIEEIFYDEFLKYPWGYYQVLKYG